MASNKSNSSGVKILTPDQIYNQSLTAANGTPGTFASTKIPTTKSATEKVGLLIRKIRYRFSNEGTCAFEGLARYSKMIFGLAHVNFSAIPSPTTTGLVDYNMIIGDCPVAAPTNEIFLPPKMTDVMRDLDLECPNIGGILMHPASIYIWHKIITAFVGPITYTVTLYYDEVEISQDLWDELWKQLIVNSAV